ncbi:hypothetical protein KGF54_005202 [Candida jiufengensis]|uniref:uncharacterized protein n=1 Tax=Candida jiufengensis TaxID=497108 RepID=UPI0022259AF3|nr:uncharacterized protein KGF54_005202 [Candida jiufengensis]KAI5950245.1 hypothetical protein KGF54_005202 [Candida jiufengensis]
MPIKEGTSAPRKRDALKQFLHWSKPKFNSNSRTGSNAFNEEREDLDEDYLVCGIPKNDSTITWDNNSADGENDYDDLRSCAFFSMSKDIIETPITADVKDDDLINGILKLLDVSKSTAGLDEINDKLSVYNYNIKAGGNDEEPKPKRIYKLDKRFDYYLDSNTLKIKCGHIIKILQKLDHGMALVEDVKTNAKAVVPRMYLNEYKRGDSLQNYQEYNTYVEKWAKR